MKYAIIETGGKQYKVSEGQRLRVEKVTGEAGQKIRFTRVLAYGDGNSTQWGKPNLESVQVIGEIAAQDRAAKVMVFKKKRRKGYSKHFGHRQSYSEILIQSIAG